MRGRSTVDGLAVYRRESSPIDAPRIVVVHGAMDRAAGFVKVGRHLTDLDVVRYDRRGYGRSQGAGIATTFDAHADDLLAVIGEQPAVVFGHSAGGVIALVAAARRPELVRAVFAYESPTPWASWYPNREPTASATDATDDEVRALVDSFMDVVVGAERWRSLNDATREQRYADGRALIADLTVTSVTDAPFDASAVRQPVVSAYGTASRSRHQRSAEELATTLPNAELHVIEGAGHMAPDTHPAEVAALVRRTVERAGC